ncbi:MBL fold metallo-hydrolase [Pseudoroseicyclus sp. CXY001]|uniref:MBL fold metallo-hydrolase n=1 Tax=Pseudoroseicyclus sp. CXY001 TaxID=3242492 RepID=UPI00358DC3A8
MKTTLRAALAAAAIAVAGVATPALAQNQPDPLPDWALEGDLSNFPPPTDVAQPQEDFDTLTPRGMWIEYVTEGFYIVRGPLYVCTPGGFCSDTWGDDGIIHEPGVVAVRVTPEGVIIADSKFDFHVEELVRLIGTVTDQPIRYAVATHAHGDHNGGLSELMKLGVEVVVQDDFRTAYARDTADEGEPIPRITYGDHGSITLGGVRVEMIHLPMSHTASDSVIFFPDLKIIHGGDVMLEAMPHIDYPRGGSAIGWADAVYEMLKLDFETVVSGHGRLLTREEVVQYGENVHEMNDRMEEIVREGIPVDEAYDALGLESWGWELTGSTSTFKLDVPAYYEEMAAIIEATDAIAEQRSE